MRLKSMAGVQLNKIVRKQTRNPYFLYTLLPDEVNC